VYAALTQIQKLDLALPPLFPLFTFQDHCCTIIA
jgi:hypothetical protein